MSRLPSEYTIQEASATLGVPVQKLRRWDAQGVLVARRTSGGHRRYAREIIDGLTGMPADAERPPAQASATANPYVSWKWHAQVRSGQRTAIDSNRRATCGGVAVPAVSARLTVVKPAATYCATRLSTRASGTAPS